MQTLLTLLQVASVQSRRTPHIPYYPAVPEPDRDALMENIMAITPDHMHRAELVATAEDTWKKKKKLHSENKVKVQAFETMLKTKREQLHKTAPGADVDSRREMKLKAHYMEDKFMQEKDTGRVPVGVARGVVRKESGERKEGVKKNDVVRRDSRASSEERERATQRLKVDKRSSRSQEMLLDNEPDEPELGVVVADSGRREVFQVRENWAEPMTNHKVLLMKEDAARQAWGRGVASQESYSQDSNYSMPFLMEREQKIQKNRERNQIQSQSNSQPDYYTPKEPVSINSFGLTPPTKPRQGHHRKHRDDLEEGKRKSFGDIKDIPKVARYFDTLERKKKAEESSESERTPQSKRRTPYEEMRPAYVQLANSPGGASGSAAVTRPSCLKSSSLVTTSSNTSSTNNVEVTQAFTSSGSSSGAGGGGPPGTMHQSQVAGGGSRKGPAKESVKSGIPRAQKHVQAHGASSQPERGVGNYTQEHALASKRSKKPQINNFPSRYSMVEYHNSRVENSLSPSPTLSPKHARQGDRINDSPKRRGNLKKTHEQRDKSSLTSNSDDSTHEGRYPAGSGSKHVQIQRDAVSEIFDSDTLIVDRRKKKGGARDSSSLPNHALMRTRPSQAMSQPETTSLVTPSSHVSIPHNHQQQVRFRNYSDHVPQGGFKATPHSDMHLAHSMYKAAPPTSSHASKGSSNRTAPSSYQPHNIGTKPSKVQFQFQPGAAGPVPGSERQHPSQHKSSIPMRATKSAQTPQDSGDTPLTSYPRSHVEALQRRSASNGRVRDMQLQHGRPGHAPHTSAGGGVARTTRQGYVGGAANSHPHPLHVGYAPGAGVANGSSNYTDVMVGSLV